MHILTDLIEQASRAVRPHLGEIAVALVATLLVIYGNAINGALKRRVAAWPFVLRVGAFVLLCAAGYGAAVVYAAPLVAHLFAQLGALWLAPLVVAAFLAVGVLAERKRQV